MATNRTTPLVLEELAFLKTPMNRRQAIKATLSGAAAAFVLREERIAADSQGPASSGRDNTLYLNPGTGADGNSGAKDSPLRSLAEAARRVNQSTGSGPMTIVLGEGIYAIGETTLLKPAGRSFSRAA